MKRIENHRVSLKIGDSSLISPHLPIDRFHESA